MITITANFNGHAVRYTHAEQNLLLVLFGFAGSVIATRSFLQVTGYPQFASGDFHISHVIWGGLLLFAASLILLIWRGRRVQWLGSLLTGIGFGLFIDEIGKFITKSNDYFYPLAAPVIYALFLLTVFIYLRVRDIRMSDKQADVCRVIEILERGIDPNLSPQEEMQIRQRLSQIAGETNQPDAASLAGHALQFLEAEKARPKMSETEGSTHWREWLHQTESGWITPNLLKVALIIGFIYLAFRGLFAAVTAFLLSIELSIPAGMQRFTTSPWAAGSIFGMPRIQLLIVVLIFEALVGFTLLTSAGLIMAGHLRRGLTFGYWGLLFNLTVLYLPILYFQQFEVMALILLQFGLFLGVIRYRSRYLDSGPRISTSESREPI